MHAADCRPRRYRATVIKSAHRLTAPRGKLALAIGLLIALLTLGTSGSSAASPSPTPSRSPTPSPSSSTGASATTSASPSPSHSIAPSSVPSAPSTSTPAAPPSASPPAVSPSSSTPAASPSAPRAIPATPLPAKADKREKDNRLKAKGQHESSVPTRGPKGKERPADVPAHGAKKGARAVADPWGDDWYGQLGDGVPTERGYPRQSGSLTSVVAIAGGIEHSLALKSDGTVWAWGDNFFGELGDGTTTNRTAPVQVVGLTGVAAIAAGRYHSLAVKTDGTAWAWGWNAYGQLGVTATGQCAGDPCSLTPVQITALNGVAQIAGGSSHSLARKSDGTVWAWGNNGDGQLGDGTTTTRTAPAQVGGLAGVSKLAAGGWHSVALKSDGSVWTWGYNADGELGDGSAVSKSAPVQTKGIGGVGTLGSITDIAAGLGHSLA